MHKIFNMHQYAVFFFCSQLCRQSFVVSFLLVCFANYILLVIVRKLGS